MPPGCVRERNVCADWSPQLMSTAQGASSPGSANAPRSNAALAPSLAIWLNPGVTVGETLRTCSAAEYSLNPPSLSMILPRTVRGPLSIVGQLTEAVVV